MAGSHRQNADVDRQHGKGQHTGQDSRADELPADLEELLQRLRPRNEPHANPDQVDR